MPFKDPSKRSQYNRLYHQSHRAERKVYSAKNRQKILAARKRFYWKHREKLLAKHSIRRRAAYAAIRVAVISHYSAGTNVCSCCGEDWFFFLTIDHVNNDGATHRRSIRGTLYEWLFRHGFPDGFQVLCYNCNCAKQRGGCPPSHRG